MDNYTAFVIGKITVPKKLQWIMGTDCKKKPIEKHDYIQIGKLYESPEHLK